MVVAIATILIAYISAFMLSNQAFAQDDYGTVLTGVQHAAKVLAGHEARLGQVLAGKILGHVPHVGLGCSPLDPRGC